MVTTSSVKLPGSLALVTGAGSGIGRATALALAGAGARVLAVDIDEASAKSTAESCTSRGPYADAVRLRRGRGRCALRTRRHASSPSTGHPMSWSTTPAWA